MLLGDRYAIKKEAEKILKYKNLTIVTEGIWKVKKNISDFSFFFLSFFLILISYT
jgi:hypothetical protein